MYLLSVCYRHIYAAMHICTNIKENVQNSLAAVTIVEANNGWLAVKSMGDKNMLTINTVHF